LDARETNATYRPSAEIAGSKEPSLAGWPLVLTEMRPVVRRARSRMNTPPPWAPATRLDAAESNVTKRPSAEIDGSEASSLIDPPLVGTDTLRVVCDTRSRTNTRYRLIVRPGTRLDAEKVKATNLPSAEMDGSKESPLSGLPLWVTDARLVVCATRSRTNTSCALGSPRTRFDASESKATNRPLAEIDGSEELPLPVRPLVLTDTSRVVCATRSRTNTSTRCGLVLWTRFCASEANTTYRPSAEMDLPTEPTRRAVK